MKKIIIAAFTMLTIGATQADYILKYPLEEAKGGSLPSGSIHFKSTVTTTPEPEASEPICLGNLYYNYVLLFLDGSGSAKWSIVESGMTVYTEIRYPNIQYDNFYDLNGYRYTIAPISPILHIDENNYYYKFCKTPII